MQVTPRKTDGSIEICLEKKEKPEKLICLQHHVDQLEKFKTQNWQYLTELYGRARKASFKNSLIWSDANFLKSQLIDKEITYVLEETVKIDEALVETRSILKKLTGQFKRH